MKTLLEIIDTEGTENIHQTINFKTNKTMIQLANTKENKAKVSALKKIGQTKWSGTTIHTNLEMCLVAINLDSTNSGWYKPSAVKINGLTGYFMINQDGSLFCEARIIKQDEKKYLIEYLSMQRWNEFENLI